MTCAAEFYLSRWLIKVSGRSTAEAGGFGLRLGWSIQWRSNRLAASESEIRLSMHPPAGRLPRLVLASISPQLACLADLGSPTVRPPVRRRPRWTDRTRREGKERGGELTSLRSASPATFRAPPARPRRSAPATNAAAIAMLYLCLRGRRNAARNKIQ
jgi:hypothetical protein